MTTKAGSEITLVVDIQTKPNLGREQVAMFVPLAALVRTSPGCLQYSLYQDVERPDHLLLLERWASQRALADHESSPHMLRADRDSGLLRERPATVREVVDRGEEQSPKASIATITIEAINASELAVFWSGLLGYYQAAHPSASIRLQDPRGDGPALLLQPGRNKVGPKSRLHLDLTAADSTATVARALELGASVADIGQTGTEAWTVMADPEGNEFCVLDTA